MLYKNLMLIFLLMLTNFHVLTECGHGECVPIVCWREKCDPNYYGILGCEDEDENAMVKKVSFEYKNAAGVGLDTGGKGFLPNYGTVIYTIKLGNNVDDGTLGVLEIYPPKSRIPDNPPSDYLIWRGETMSRGDELKYSVDFYEAMNNLILGNLSNKLLIGGKTFEFDGPYMSYNINLNNIKTNATEDGRYLENITIEARANEDLSFSLSVKDEKLVPMTYLVNKFHKNFTNLLWTPFQWGRKIEPSIRREDIHVNPKII